MKTNAERARERLTLTPAAEFTLEKDGFIGALYQPERDEYPGKAVIMFGHLGLHAIAVHESTGALLKQCKAGE